MFYVVHCIQQTTLESTQRVQTSAEDFRDIFFAVYMNCNGKQEKMLAPSADMICCLPCSCRVSQAL